LEIMNKQDNKEHRKHERFPFVEDILIDGTKSCTSTDISEGGLFISAIQSFESGDVMEVSIPTKSEKIIAKAEVKYCQRGIGMGIAFIEADEDLRIRIKELVDSIANK
jgi:hypothetical protein